MNILKIKYKLHYSKKLLNISILLFFGLIIPVSGYAQNYLHTDGQRIVNGSGENVILRGIGTGNWMLQEGYMMKSSGVAGTQHEFRSKLIATIGEEKTDTFYETWLNNHFTKRDVDSMAVWGFNSIRVAMHYKWFTPPIEEEPVSGEITWNTKGFEMIDDLLSWCSDNQMYLILDLHGAPGGQGKNADISDYDSSKPSLWESDLNKAKTVALWKKLAERYATEPWIGGYDLINEVNWSFPEGNNSKLRELYIQITNAIREVDSNHIIFIEGNWFANDFSGLTPPWDSNMAYSFHKYWTYNDENSLKWVTDLRSQNNVPIWLGESGENSNTWFTNLVQLSEENNIGWSWWPVKKTGTNNVLKVENNQDYDDLIDAWRNENSVSSDKAYQAVMAFAENHKIENCTVQYDVIDALIRQPNTTETKAFKAHDLASEIFAVDYDLGRNKYAYFDQDTADYHLNTDNFGTWNTGWTYRNDGVDIEECKDASISNGYSVGWIEKGEWLQYTLQTDEAKVYQMEFRIASANDVVFHIEINGERASENISFASTGSWDTWKSYTVDDIIIPSGEVKVKIVFDTNGFNFNYFKFKNPTAIAEQAFKFLSAETDVFSKEITVFLNKDITTDFQASSLSNFQLIINNALVSLSSFSFLSNSKKQIKLVATDAIYYEDRVRISYSGETIKNENQLLTKFVGEEVNNKNFPHTTIPAKIEAENFYINSGFELEDCTDIGGGENTAYASNGDFLDYIIKVPEAGTYQMDFRVAALNGAPEILLMNTVDGKLTVNKQLLFQSTGGWQNWQTQSTDIALPKGKLIFRLYSRSGEFNLNWFSFDLNTGIQPLAKELSMKVSPNPASSMLYLNFDNKERKSIALYTMQGKQIESLNTSDQKVKVDIQKYPVGNYIVQCISSGFQESMKIQIAR